MDFQQQLVHKLVYYRHIKGWWSWNHLWLISRCKRLGYCRYNQPSYSQLINDADESFSNASVLMMDTFYNHY